jgi:hypothetical protein
VEQQPYYFTGPLGLWPFPIINLILSIVFSIRYAYAFKPLATATNTPFENEEYYKIIRDEKGEIVGIEIHRRVVPVVKSA